MIDPVTQCDPQPVGPAPFSASAGQRDDAAFVNAPDDLLRWLLRFPLLRVEELAFLSGLSRSRAYTRLSLLQDQMLVTRWRTPALAGTGTYLYAPTAHGLGALAATYGPTIWPLARHWQADERGVQRLLLCAPALVRTQSFVISLLASASRGLCIPAHTPVSAASGQGQAQIEWSWQRDYPLRFTHRSHTGRVRLSAYVRWAVKQPGHRVPHTTQRQWYGLFILADSEMMDEQYHRRQLRALAQCRDTFLDQSPDGYFPPILILSSDAHRAVRWQALALRLATEQWQIHPLMGAVLSMNEADAGTPWQSVWHTLTSATTCHLTDVLTPLENAACLPPLSVSSKSSDGNQKPAQRLVEQRVYPQTTHQASSAVFNRLTQAAQRLDPRHLSLIKLLGEHPLLSAGNLATFLGVTEATMDRYLRLLIQCELISDQPGVKSDDSDAQDPERTSSEKLGHDRRFTLTRLGLNLLAAGAGLTRLHASVASTPTFGSARRLPLYAVSYEREVTAFAQMLAHTAGVYDFFAQVATSARLSNTHSVCHRLLWWETGRACERHYREQDGWHAVRPDGAGEYQAGQRRLRFWLEWDRGTMNRRDLTVKFAAYEHYIRSREWRTDGNTPLPFLLIVTADEGQETRIGAALNATLAPGTALPIRITQRMLLADPGLRGPIWRIWTPDTRYPNTSEYGRFGALPTLFDESTW